jgi:uncharacterized protein
MRMLLVATAVIATAGRVVAFDLPAKPAARVNDYAGVLSASAKNTIEGRLAAFERDSSTQVVVATVSSLDGDVIEDVAVRTVERWGLGQKDRNNGVLLLIAVGDRHAKIEVGYGLEDRLTDALSRRILEDQLFPALRNRDYDGGVLATCEAIIAATQGAYTSPPRARKKNTWPAAVVPFAIIVLFVLLSAQRGRGLSGRGRRGVFRTGPFWWGGWGGGGGSPGGGWGGGGWGGGGGGGGFGGFSGGGGMSGGGGASGSW